MPLKKPSEFYDKNPNSSLDEIRENVTPQKVEKISEAFDSFKSNFDHIQSLTEFTNTFDTFKNNIEKVDNLSESVSDINDSIQDLIKKEDLDDAMTAQLLFVEESIRSVQDKVKTLNSKSVFAIKEEFSSLSETVYNFIDEEVPSYQKLIVDSETRVDSRFLNFKKDITSKVEDVHKEINSNLSHITESIESINEENLSSVKEDVKGIRGKVESLLEKVLPKYKKFFAETEVRTEEKIAVVEETAKEIEEKYESQIKEITENFDQFVHNEIPKYKKLLVDSKLKTEGEVKDISKSLDEQVSKINKNVVNLQQRVNNKEIEIDDVLLEKTNTIDKLINKSKDLSRIYDDLSRDFKEKEVQYENALDDFSKKINTMEESLTDNICELQENLDTSTSKYYSEMKNAVVPAVVNFEQKLSSQLKDLNINFAVNEKHIDNLKKEFQNLVEDLKVPVIKKDWNILEEKSEKLNAKIDRLEKVLEEFNEKKVGTLEQDLREGLLNIPPDVDNSDPLTPIGQKYVTFDKLAEHYRLFVNRVQQQIATLGGGGEVFLARMEDVDVGAGIATDGFVLAWDKDLQLFTPSAGGSAGAGGTWASNSVGVSTTKNVGIGTTAKAGYALDVEGNARVTGILTVGRSTITLNPNDDIITVGTGITLDATNSKILVSGNEIADASGNANYSGIITATTLSATTGNFSGNVTVGGTITYEDVKNLDSIGLVTARSGVDVGYDHEGGTGVGITMKPSGNAVFAGVVTAAHMFYPPVITTVQRDALTVNAGALIFNTTSTQLEIYNGTTWVGVGAVNNLTISNL